MGFSVGPVVIVCQGCGLGFLHGEKVCKRPSPVAALGENGAYKISHEKKETHKFSRDC